MVRLSGRLRHGWGTPVHVHQVRLRDRGHRVCGGVHLGLPRNVCLVRASIGAVDGCIFVAAINQNVLLLYSLASR